MRCRTRRTSLGRVARTGVLLLGLSTLLWPTSAHADRRTDYLVRLLRTSGTFRVRAQAALSLGRVGGTREHRSIVIALSKALKDRHPAVRSAAASSLRRRRDPRALGALRLARRDRDRRVRSTVARAIRALESVARRRKRARRRATRTPSEIRARYYVGVGLPGSNVRSLGREELINARDFIRDKLTGMGDVRVAPDRETRTQAQRILTQERMTGYFIDSSVVRIENNPNGTRAVVSVVVNTYPGRDMRMILRGGATVQGGGRGVAVRRQAIEGAYTSALRRLPQAFSAGGS